MPTKPFGKTGVALPVIGQGTWDIAERGTGKTRAIEALRRGIELGMTHIDTAEMYGSGRVEEIVGEAIHPYDRERLFITSKVLPSNASYGKAIAACERSLRRLKLDHLDLYLLHWPSEYPLRETMRAFDALVESGKTRFVGVSNFEEDEMTEAAGLLRARLACNQVLYHMRERGIERRLVPAGARANVAIVGYTPFGRGRFPREESRPDGVLGRIARERAATPRAVILAFLTREENAFTIPKASSREHVEENARAGALTLTAQEVAEIDAAFPIGEDGPLASL
ncbi:MAG: aldo/keto reductase [Candidatus Tyrphobacter sp.]